MSRILAFLLLLVLPASACLWDRDTLREEAKGKLDTVRAITGWFDRYPPRYYEMRLDRVTGELAANPRDLHLHDDAGVACSRLGRHDESIAWMARKKAALDSLPDGGPADDRYRYLSNLGTFHLIRWITTEASVRSANLSDLEVSETHIAAALEINPDAHFGREKYQLMLIQWLLGKASTLDPNHSDPNFLGIDARLMLNPGGRSRVDPEREAARKGVTGLIQLGAAWESIDTFRALQVCLHSQQAASLAHLAYLRQKELADSGAFSLHPDERVREHMNPQGYADSFHGAGKVERFYYKARAAAATRDTAWVAYQEQRFAEGEHPDTHPSFWSKWKEPEMPAMPNLTFGHLTQRYPQILLILLVVAPPMVFVAILMLGRKRARAGKSTVTTSVA